MSRILAIDFGERRIGLAISDETRTIAQGLTVLDCGVRSANCGVGTAVEQIAEIVVEREVGHIILGYPTSMSGKPSTRGNEVEAFKTELQKNAHVPVELVDERFTTALAHRYLSETHKKVRPDKQPVDMVAATVLLEDYLARRSPESEAQSPNEEAEA
jgi:putative Holliday junction resolvase